MPVAELRGEAPPAERPCLVILLVGSVVALPGSGVAASESLRQRPCVKANVDYVCCGRGWEHEARSSSAAAVGPPTRKASGRPPRRMQARVDELRRGFPNLEGYHTDELLDFLKQEGVDSSLFDDGSISTNKLQRHLMKHWGVSDLRDAPSPGGHGNTSFGSPGRSPPAAGFAGGGSYAGSFSDDGEDTFGQRQPVAVEQADLSLSPASAGESRSSGSYARPWERDELDGQDESHGDGQDDSYGDGTEEALSVGISHSQLWSEYEPLGSSDTLPQQQHGAASEVGALATPERRRGVAMHAWRELAMHHMHAKTQQRLAVGLQYAVVGINLAAALMAMIETQVIVDELQAALDTHAPGGAAAIEAEVSGLRLLMVMMPLGSGLCLALLKGFNPGTKAAALEYSSGAIESEIYRWRTRTGEYAWGTARTRRSVAAAAAGGGGGPHEEDVRHLEDELRCRKRFREHVSHLSHGSSVANADGGVPAWHMLNRGNKAAGGSTSATSAGSLWSDDDKNPGPSASVVGVSRSRSRGVRTVTQGGYGGCDALEHDEYIVIRLGAVLEAYTAKVPDLEQQLQGCQIGICCLTAVSVLLAAMDITLWLPMTILLTASVSAVADLMQLHPKLLATNHAITQLKELQLWWSSLERNERDIPSNFELLVDGVESACLAGLGGGIAYTCRKVSTWRADDDHARVVEVEDHAMKTEERRTEANETIGALTTAQLHNDELERDLKATKKMLATAEKRLEKRQKENGDLEETVKATNKKIKETRAADKSRADESRAEDKAKISGLQLSLEEHKRQVQSKETENGKLRKDAGAARQEAVAARDGKTDAAADASKFQSWPRYDAWSERPADRAWSSLGEHATSEELEFLHKQAQTLGYGTEQAWDRRDQPAGGYGAKCGPWEYLSTEQQLAANHLGLYAKDFETSPMHSARVRLLRDRDRDRDRSASGSSGRR